MDGVSCLCRPSICLCTAEHLVPPSPLRTALRDDRNNTLWGSRVARRRSARGMFCCSGLLSFYMQSFLQDENPASVCSWHVRQVGALFAHQDCGIVPLSYCQCGAPCRKHTKFGFIYASFLFQFERVCHGGHEHIQLRGALTILASQYPPCLCSEFASAIAYA